MTTPTETRLKQELWSRFGTREHPAEWDGFVFGGGRLSQRFWEYFKTIELMDLQPDSVVLDIGGGSFKTGLGFFSELLSTQVAKVFVLDPEIQNVTDAPPSVTLIPAYANYEELAKLFMAHPEITHVCAVSVLEHVPAGIRREIFQAIDDHFKGHSLVLTFEYHATRVFFEHQLTARTLSEMVEPLKRLYLDAFHASPVHCENAIDPCRTLKIQRKRNIFKRVLFGTLDTPRWYPVVLRFLRS